MLEKSVAAAAVAVLGLVASLNFVDQSTIHKVTSYPLYQQWLGDSASESSTTADSIAHSPKAKAPLAQNTSQPSSQQQDAQQQDPQQQDPQPKATAERSGKAPTKTENELSMAALKAKAVAWFKSVDVEKLQAQAQTYAGKAERLAVQAKNFLVAQYEKLTKSQRSDKTAKGSASGNGSGA